MEAEYVTRKRRWWYFLISPIPERIELVRRVVDMFDIVDILDRRSKDETGEHHTYAVRWLVLLDVLPDSQFAELLPSAVADVCIVCLSRIFQSNLKVAG